MRLGQPNHNRDKEFYVLVQTLFNQEKYIVGSNILNYYEHCQLDDLNKCEKFRMKTARMNSEGQSCLLDMVDTTRNCLAGCIGYVKVNRVSNEAQFALIYYQQYIAYVKEATMCFTRRYLISKHNLKSVVCETSSKFIHADAVDILQSVGFLKNQNNESCCTRLTYTAGEELDVNTLGKSIFQFQLYKIVLLGLI